jgi:hypothetical protein
MKPENLNKAAELREKLRLIESKISAAGSATGVILCGKNNDNIRSADLKQDSRCFTEYIKALFLTRLQLERAGILDEINEID